MSQLGLLTLAPDECVGRIGVDGDIDRGADKGGSCHHFVEIDAGRDTHALKHVQDVFGRDIAGGTLGVGTTAEPCHRAVNDRHATAWP